MKKLRKMEEVQMEYSQTATMLGDLTYRKSVLEKDIRNLQTTMGKLQEEAATINQLLGMAKEQGEPVDQKVQNITPPADATGSITSVEPATQSTEEEKAS